MRKYTTGTRGGSDASENVLDWESCHESYMLEYVPQKDAHLYLTIVFMWDKEHQFPFKPPVGDMPPGSNRDDKTVMIDLNNTDTTDATQSSKSQISKQSDIGSITTALQQLSGARQKSTNEFAESFGWE